MLSQGIEISDPPVTAPQPLPPAAHQTGHPTGLVTSSAPAHRYHMPPNTTGQSHVRIRSPPRLRSPPRMPSLPRIIGQPILAPAAVPRRGPNQCSKCKKPKVEPSHRQYFGNWYCKETTGESYDDLAERMRPGGIYQQE